ncbi:MAG TPA: DUF5916 domain-containing protein [Thermoanaerobaculia bacterium]|nr:DUF5916 domain-containing protein [Thermoanaerobaculia bacterium]
MRALGAVVGIALLAGWLGSGGEALAQAVPEGEEAPVAQAAPPGRYQVHPLTRASSAITIDGRLDEPAWADARVIPVAYEWYPGENLPAPVATECLVTYDEEHLYVGFRADDPEPGAIRAYYADRDTPTSDDTVGFFIDAFNDRRRAFYFQVNPLGVQTDAVVVEFAPVTQVGPREEKLQRLDYSWDAIWDSVGRITESGYVVELAIPFKQLRFPAGTGPQTWGFLASREYPRDVFHVLRSGPIDRGRNCFVCQFEAVAGLTGMATGVNVEVVPTLTGIRADTRASLDAPLVEGGEDAELGVTGRWSITPNTALGATVNPDFSQVEADAVELNVNERFALRFPEKRPFFLEAADFFETPLEAVFTRTVADPAYGARLTGKQGASAFGVMFTEDDLNNLVIPGPESSTQRTLDQDVRAGILRYRRDLGETSTLGVLYTGREATGYHNHVYGLDGNWRATESDTFRFQLLGSDTRYPQALAASLGQPTDSFDGSVWLADYSHLTRNWRWVVGAGVTDTDFRADSGFMPNVGVREAGGVLQRFIWGGPDTWFRRLTLHLDGLYTEDDATGDVLGRNANVQLFYEGPMQSVVRAAIRPNDESFRGNEFTNVRGDLLIKLRPWGAVGLELFLRGGEVIDVANVRQAEVFQIRPRIDFQVGRNFFGDLQYNRQTFDVADGGGEFQRAEVISSTFRYHFNPRIFVRTIVQHRDVERDLSLYVPPVRALPEEESLLGQFLFAYKLDARTLLYAGYTENEIGNQNFDLTRQARTFFIKLSYALLW